MTLSHYRCSMIIIMDGVIVIVVTLIIAIAAQCAMDAGIVVTATVARFAGAPSTNCELAVAFSRSLGVGTGLSFKPFSA